MNRIDLIKYLILEWLLKTWKIHERKLIYFGVLVFFLIHIIAFIVIDVKSDLYILKWLIVFSPVLYVLAQLNIWKYYVKNFGIPKFKDMLKMLELDGFRAYAGATIKEPLSAGRPSIVASVGMFLTLSGASYILWLLTNLSVFLFFTVYCVILSIKRIMRLSRPPAMFLLGASSKHGTDLFWHISSAIRPMDVITLTLHDESNPNITYHNNFRSYNENDWKRVVTDLMSISPIIILDLRSSTIQVEFELNHILNNEKIFHKTLYVSDNKNTIGVPEERYHSEEILIECLKKRFGGDTC